MGKEGDKKWFMKIESITQSKWTGLNSVIDREAETKIYSNFNLEKEFSLSEEDFRNLFCFAYITSAEYGKPHYSKFIHIEQEANSEEEHHFIFNANHEGWFDFSFRQPEFNMVLPKT